MPALQQTSLRPAPLRLGAVQVDPPVVLAPMAGITNAAYRQLCREQGAGLYVCEMITSRGIVERIPKTFDMLRFDAGETVRSVQLYGVDPPVLAKATENTPAEPPRAASGLAPARFARDPREYRSTARNRPDWMTVIDGGATTGGDEAGL